MVDRYSWWIFLRSFFLGGKTFVRFGKGTFLIFSPAKKILLFSSRHLLTTESKALLTELPPGKCTHTQTCIIIIILLQSTKYSDTSCTFHIFFSLTEMHKFINHRKKSFFRITYIPMQSPAYLHGLRNVIFQFVISYNFLIIFLQTWIVVAR